MSQQPHIQSVNMIGGGTMTSAVPMSGNMPYISVPVPAIQSTNNYVDRMVRPISTVINPSHIVGNTTYATVSSTVPQSSLITPKQTQLPLANQPGSGVNAAFVTLPAAPRIITHQQQPHSIQISSNVTDLTGQNLNTNSHLVTANSNNVNCATVANTVMPGPTSTSVPNTNPGNVVVPPKDKGSQYLPIEQIVREVDPQMMVSDDVDESIQIILGSFVEKIASMAAEAAVHRGSNVVLATDVNLILNLHTDYGPNKLTLKHRKYDKHRQRMAMIRKSVSAPIKRN